MQVTLAEAKARLSELIRLVETGETIEITRRGKVAARMTAAEAPRERIDIERLRRLHETMPMLDVSAAELVRAMRDEDRY